MKLTQTQINGLIRHFLTFVGGILLTLGYIDSTALEMASGSIMTLVGIVMSALNKKRAEEEPSTLSESESESDVIADSDDKDVDDSQ